VRGQNEHEVIDMAALSIENLEVRFLEIMPMEGVGMVYDEGLVRTEETRRYSNRLWTAPPDRLPPVQPGAALAIAGGPRHHRLHLARIGSPSASSAIVYG